MRLRHIKGCEDFVAASSSVAHSPEQYRGKWKEFFGNDHPVELEIGMGKGRFIIEQALLHPDWDFLGIERYESVLFRACEKMEGIPYETPAMRLERLKRQEKERVRSGREMSGGAEADTLDREDFVPPENLHFLHMDAGKLVPDEVIVGIVKERVAQDDCKPGYILDGFPRTVPQAEALEKIAKIDVVVEIAVADEALVKRLSGRRVCLNCGATYHVSTLGGKTTCDKCGEELIQRKDDNPETVQNRLNVYHSQTAPLISFYQERGLLKTFDGMQDIDVVYRSIMDALRKAE